MSKPNFLSKIKAKKEKIILLLRKKLKIQK